nr:receptor protein kinase [Fagopyrum tataricum]
MFVKLDDRFEPTCILEEPLQQDFSIIRNATNNFSDDNRLGSGGFGTVYKAEVAGKIIAVKKLERDSITGDVEFKNEARIAAKLQHNNLSQLLGYCVEGFNRLLIFEFVSNGSLDQILSGK